MDLALIADVLMICGALGVAGYCMVLSRRLNRFSDLDGGVGKAIADLNAQVSDLSKTLAEARRAAAESSAGLAQLTVRAETVANALENSLSELEQRKGPVPQPEMSASWQPAPEARQQPVADVGRSAQAESKGPQMPAFIRGRSARTAAE